MRPANPINIRQLDHVVLRVENLELMVEWYCNVLGCRLERGPGELGLAQLRAGASLIDLVDLAGPLGTQGGSPPKIGGHNMDHFCVQVAPWDAGAIVAHLERHGCDPDGIATRYGAQGSGPSVYLQDPEGNGVELKGSSGS